MKTTTNMIMQFHCAGVTTESEYPVLNIDSKKVTLETDEDHSKCYKFDLKTGKCLNDNTFAGARRTLKI